MTSPRPVVEALLPDLPQPLVRRERGAELDCGPPQGAGGVAVVVIERRSRGESRMVAVVPTSAASCT